MWAVTRLQRIPVRSDELVCASDADLARALCANEPDAFRLIWQRFSPVVRRRLRRALGTAVGVNDLAQEVFLSLLGSIHKLRQPQALSAFVLTIARNAASRELRRRRARAHLNLAMDPLEVSAFDLRDATAHHAFVHLHIVLGRLNKRDRLAFTLRFVEGMNAKEIADALGVSVSTARRCFSRAWKRVSFFADRNLFLSEYLGESGAAATSADF